MSLTALKVAKFAVSGLVGIGTGKIVGAVIKNHVTPETTIDKVTVTAAAWVISAMVTKATKNATNEMIDDAVKTAVEVVDNFKENAKLGRINRKESNFEKEKLDVNNYEKDEAGNWHPIKVKFCSLCEDPTKPDLKFHPNKQRTHVEPVA